MRGFTHFTALALCLLSATADAEIHRCIGTQGEPLYSGRPCHSPSTTLSVHGVHTVPAPGGIRASEKAWLEERARGARKARSDRPVAVDARKAASQEDRRAYRCRSKRRSLEALDARLRAGYKASAGDRLHRRRAAYRDYLDSFCS